MQPGLDREHCQQGQRQATHLVVGQSEPRQKTQENEECQCNRKPTHNRSWWTGEDSNLRSSKERQVYSLLPLTARPPVRTPQNKLNRRKLARTRAAAFFLLTFEVASLGVRTLKSCAADHEPGAGEGI